MLPVAHGGWMAGFLTFVTLQRACAGWIGPIASFIAAALVIFAASAASAQILHRHPKDLLGHIFNPDTGPSTELFGEIAADTGALLSGAGDAHEDRVSLRRAKLGLQGRLVRDLGYKIVGDFASGEFGVTDSYLVIRPEWTKLRLSLRAGHFKPPSAFEFQSSARFLSFIERSAPSTAFGAANQFGVAADLQYGDIGLGFGVFNGSEDPERPDSDGRNLMARVFRATQTQGEIWHFGAEARYRDPRSGDLLRYRARLPLHLESDRFVDTGPIGHEELHASVEMFHASGPWHFLAAAFQSNAALEESGERAQLWGVNGEVGLWLTGESAAEGYGGGQWRRPDFAASPLGEGGRGSFQLVAGVDYVDLEDGSVRGGRQGTVRAGLNWWPRNNARISLNAGVSRLRNSPTISAVQKGGDATVISVGIRAQFDF